MTSPERTGEWAGGPENLRDTTENEAAMQDSTRDKSRTETADELQQTERTGAKRSGLRQDTAQIRGTSGAERTREMENAEDDDMSSYYQEILNEIKNDLQELKSEIKQFTEKEL